MIPDGMRRINFVRGEGREIVQEVSLSETVVAFSKFIWPLKRFLDRG